MKSIIQNLDEPRCYVCGTWRELELHHIMHGSANRRWSTRLGLVCYLCRTHHTGKFGVHSDPDLDRMLKIVAQAAFEKTRTRAEWMNIFKKNYLD